MLQHRVLLTFVLLFKFSSSKDITISCIVRDSADYSHNPNVCDFEDLSVISADIVVTSVEGRVDTDVTSILGHESKNELVYVPNGLGDVFPNLEEIILTGCKIKFIKRKNFSNMKKVTFIQLYSNVIETIPADAFNDLSSLQTLHLFRNQIKAIPAAVFGSLVNLKEVSFGYNPIDTLETTTFNTNTKLENIFAKNAKLKSIKFDFTKLKNIAKIDFTENVCIDAAFNKGNSTIAEFQLTVNKKCGK